MNFLSHVSPTLLQTLQDMSEEVGGEGVRREEGEGQEEERREGERQQEGAEGADELDELTRALQGFDPETGQNNKPPAEPQYVPLPHMPAVPGRSHPSLTCPMYSCPGTVSPFPHMSNVQLSRDGLTLPSHVQCTAAPGRSHPSLTCPMYSCPGTVSPFLDARVSLKSA